MAPTRTPISYTKFKYYYIRTDIPGLAKICRLERSGDDSRYVAVCPCGHVSRDRIQCENCNKYIDQLVLIDKFMKLQENIAIVHQSYRVDDIISSDIISSGINNDIMILNCGHYGDFRQYLLLVYITNYCPQCSRLVERL